MPIRCVRWPGKTSSLRLLISAGSSGIAAAQAFSIFSESTCDFRIADSV